MRGRFRRVSGRFESLESRRVLDSTAVFNELMYHPDDSDPLGEWLELRNLLSVDLDLSGWSLADGVQYTFSDGTIIPGDGMLLVAKNPESLADLPAGVAVVGPFEGSLSNSGESIRLLNNSQRTMDRVDYGDVLPWPVAADGAGPSLAKVDDYWTSADVSNWQSSLQLGGTPGRENFPVIDLAPTQTRPITLGDAWRYSDAGLDLGTRWRETAFDDQSFSEGTTPFVAGTSDSPAVAGLQFVELASGDDAGIRADVQYTHRIDFGAGQAAEINGVEFAQAGVANLGALPNFSWTNRTGVRSQATSDLAPIAGPLRELLNDYVINVFNRADGEVTMALSGLTRGTRYKTTIFSRRLDDGPREAEVSFDLNGDGVAEDAIELDQNDPTQGPVSAASSDSVIAMTYDFMAQSEQLSILFRQKEFNRPWGFYGLTNQVVGQTGQTEITAGPNTHYFRKTFDYNGDVGAQHDLQLNLLADDGAVVYLNDAEIFRHHMPLGQVSFDTPARSNLISPTATGRIDVDSGSLNVNGANTIAVEVHQSVPGNDDLLFDLSAWIVESPRLTAEQPRIVINEMPAASDDEFWIELKNIDDRPIQLNGLALEHLDRQRRANLPDIVLKPDELVLISGEQLGFLVAAEDRIVLRASDNGVLDAQVVEARATARDDRGQWLRPAQQTPGQLNLFATAAQIVINEILYHASPQFATDDEPFSETNEEWIELYNRSSEVVDLSGWSIDGGIEFIFPDGTVLSAGQYLVIANDASSLRQKYPTLQIVGDFDGRLSNDNDALTLRDRLQNPVDVVHYFDGGRWPSFADGGGSSLELMDVDAENNAAESWAPSSRDPSPWVEVQYEGTARPFRSSNEPSEWNEFIFGLLDAGEVLIDDVSVIEDPGGAAIERIQDGSFDDGERTWRLVGNHGQHGLSEVVADPDDPGNSVLHVVATGATEHMSNHVETTFRDNADISRNQAYRISFRARWLAGSPQLHTRLYFNRLAETTILPIPDRWGTPGRPNSQRQENVGPTFDALRHEPVVPEPGQDITISVSAEDPEGIDSLTLLYSIDGQPFVSTPMEARANGEYTGTIPGPAFAAPIQFYVEGVDTRGQRSTFPADGSDSRAMLHVDDGLFTDGPRHNLRILMTDEDVDRMLTQTNYLTNHRVGATVIWRGEQVYYDVGVRLKGSGFSRGGNATGFNLRFQPDQLLFGEHDVVAIDRQGGPWGIGASHRELTIKHIANRAGDIPMMYDDVIQLVGPLRRFNGSAQLLLARYDDVFLDSQFDNGSDGTRFKFDLIYYSTRTVTDDPEGLKRPPGFSRPGVFPVLGIDFRNMGDDPNAYRWNYLIRNNRDEDDYSRIINMAKAFTSSGSTVGSSLDLQTQAAIDVDQWMRLFAFESLAGINDTYNQGLPHNLQLYVRPEDQRVIALPWDMDFSLHHDTNMPIYGTGSLLRRVIMIPTNRRLFEQHLLDILETSYNVDYLTPWVGDIATVAARNDSAAILRYVRDRSRYVRQRLMSEVPFEITTNNGQPLRIDQPSATLEGNGWIDVREIRWGDRDLPVVWTDSDRWQVTVPLDFASQLVQLQAFDQRGNLVGQSEIQIETSVVDPFPSSLKVTEIQFNPAALSDQERAAGWNDNDQFEFVELTNVGQSPLALEGVEFIRDAASNDGIDYTFPEYTLEPNRSVVVAKDPQAFAARYGVDVVAIGPFDGQLSNGGELLTVSGPSGQLIQQFAYDDAWYASTDGDGRSLELLSPETAAPSDWNLPSSWRASPTDGGSPGRTPLPDVNDDGQLDVGDVDLFCRSLHEGDARLDLDDNGATNLQDVDYLVERVLGSRVGDVNLDGLFDSSDLVLIFQAGEYEDATAGNSNWSEGDWDCDGDFTTGDLVRAFSIGGYAGGGAKKRQA